MLGNQDHFRGARIAVEGLRRASIPVLINEGVELTIGNASIFLAYFSLLRSRALRRLNANFARRERMKLQRKLTSFILVGSDLC